MAPEPLLDHRIAVAVFCLVCVRNIRLNLSLSIKKLPVREVLRVALGVKDS
jgi:hypothetical protein